MTRQEMKYNNIEKIEEDEIDLRELFATIFRYKKVYIFYYTHRNTYYYSDSI